MSEETRSIVPRKDGEAGIGREDKYWGKGYFGTVKARDEIVYKDKVLSDVLAEKDKNLSDEIVKVNKHFTTNEESITANAANIAKNTSNITANKESITAVSKEVTSLKASVGTPLVAATVSAMKDKNKIYVYTGTESGYTKGNWYYNNGTKWVAGGVYNAVALVTDKTLSVIGAAADSKVCGEHFNALQENLQQLTDSYAGQKIDFEDGVYINADNKKIQLHESMALSVPIKVLGGATVKIQTYGNSALAIGLMQGDELNDAVKVTDGGNASVYTVNIDIPEWCTAIRISCFKSHKSDVSCSSPNLFAYTQKQINAVSQKADKIKYSTERQGLIHPYEWGNYSILTSSGTAYTSLTRLKTISYQKDLKSIVCKEGYKVRVWCYKEDGTYLGAWNGESIVKRDVNFSEVNVMEAYAAGAEKMLLVVLKDDNSTITPTEVDNVTILFESNNIKDETDAAISKNESISVVSCDVEELLYKRIAKQGVIHGRYFFPKDIHSVNGNYRLLTISSDTLSIDVDFEKSVTSLQDAIPQDPVPMYNAGISIKANGKEYAKLAPDGWRKEIFLGEDAMSIRFKGNCDEEANQDIRLKVDVDNITLYHQKSNIIASFAKSDYETMQDLYTAMSESPNMTQFEVLPLHLETLMPADIIECDVPLVGKYYTDETNTSTFYDAYPFYCTTKEKGKEYNIELLFDRAANYPLQILINGFCIAKFSANYSNIHTLFEEVLKITVYNNQINEIACDSVTINTTECKSMYPDIRILYCEKIEKGSKYRPGYSISENRMIGIATQMRAINRKYITMKQIEAVLDGVVSTPYTYYWTFQLDDGSINCIIDSDIRSTLLRNGIKPSIAMMPSRDITADEYKILKSSEIAGVEYHLHAPYTDPDTSIPYLTYSQLDARVTEAITKFIEKYGSIPTVWGKHKGIYHYSTCRYLKNKGFRVIFGDNAETPSLNEVTRYACKRTLIQEKEPTYAALNALKDTYGGT